MTIRPLFFVAAAMLLAVFALGPRPDLPDTFTLSEPPAALDRWLAEREAAVPGIIPGTEKRITWAGEAGQRTPLALVYLHGFSASRQELAPLPAELAAALGANLFETRLTGHGRDGAALGEATAADWIADGAEALAIGRRLGERVTLIGVSTGATLALWLAAQAPAEIDQLVLVSPNLAPARGDADLVLLPWGNLLARAVVGPEYQFETVGEQQARYWTERYPVAVLPEMMALVAATRRIVGTAELPPTLVFLSDHDQVVDPARTRALLATHRQATLVVVNDSGDPAGHVLAGDILSPETTTTLLERAAAFLAPAD